MSLVACTIGGLSIYAINEFWVRSHHFEQAAERAYKGEALNRLVTAVVMEARGIYAAADIAAAAPFADGMVKNLDAMDKLITSWAPLVPAEQKAGFDKLAGRSKEFRTFRLETVRLAKESGPQAASQQGNNEANRANRKAYQAEIDSIVKNDIAELEVVKAGVDAFSTAIFWVIVAVTVAGVGAGAAFGLYIGTRQLSAPIRRVSQVMSEVADGNLDAAVPYLGRKDEIGEMAAAVEVFKTNGREVRRMNTQESAMRAKSDGRCRRCRRRRGFQPPYQQGLWRRQPQPFRSHDQCPAHRRGQWCLRDQPRHRRSCAGRSDGEDGWRVPRRVRRTPVERQPDAGQAAGNNARSAQQHGGYQR